MNSEFNELKNRLNSADPAVDAPQASESVLNVSSRSRGRRAPMSKRRLRARLGAGAVGVTASALALSLSLNVQAAPLLRIGTQQANQSQVAGSEARGLGMNELGMNAGAAESADSKMAIWPMIQYKYSAGEGLSDQGGSGKVYQLQLDGDPIERLNKVAEMFGIEGEPVLDEWSTPEAPSYSIQGEDFYLSIYWAGTGSWSYSRWVPYPEECYVVSEPAPAEGDTNSEGADSGDAQTLPDICYGQTEATPELIPSEAEMTAAALEIMQATGLQVSAGDVRTYRDDWGGSAVATFKVDGQNTSIEWYVGWDAAGKLSYASGHSVKAIDRGTFNTISPKSAVDRLGDWRYWGSPSSDVYERVYGQNPWARSLGAAAEVSDAAGTESETVEPTMDPSAEPTPSDAAGEAAESPMPTDEVIIEPMPSDTDWSTEVQIVELTVDSAEAAMLVIWDANGGAWLVPGWIMVNSEGWFDSIFSLEDGVIELPEPIETDIMPMPAVKEGD